MTDSQNTDPLHGVTLKALLTEIVDRHGFEELAYRIPVDCFLYEPTFTSSLKFLRKNDWARKQVEQLFLADRRAQAANLDSNQEAGPGTSPETSQETGPEDS